MCNCSSGQLPEMSLGTSSSTTSCTKFIFLFVYCFFFLFEFQLFFPVQIFESAILRGFNFLYSTISFASRFLEIFVCVDGNLQRVTSIVSKLVHFLIKGTQGIFKSIFAPLGRNGFSNSWLSLYSWRTAYTCSTALPYFFL